MCCWTAAMCFMPLLRDATVYVGQDTVDAVGGSDHNLDQPRSVRTTDHSISPRSEGSVVRTNGRAGCVVTRIMIKAAAGLAQFALKYRRYPTLAV